MKKDQPVPAELFQYKNGVEWFLCGGCRQWRRNKWDAVAGFGVCCCRCAEIVCKRKNIPFALFLFSRNGRNDCGP